jgi:hypothetical protein
LVLLSSWTSDSHSPRSQPDRTRQEDRRLKFYELRDNLPFFRGDGLEAQGDPWQGPGRDFLKEVERTQRMQLDWRSPPHSAADDLFRRIQQDPQLLLAVLSFACENILLGYSFQEYDSAATRLDGALQQAGANWEVVQVPGMTKFQLRRRVVGATSQAVAQTTATAGNASDHLDRAWQHALRARAGSQSRVCGGGQGG